MTGKLEITVHKGISARIISKEMHDNIVVNGMNTQMCRMLGGDIGTSGNLRNVNRMQFGTGSLGETASDVQLQTPITPIKTIDPIVGVTYYNPYYVQFEAYLDFTEANGFAISEAGLLCQDGTLAARKVFSGISKTSDYIIEFRWRIRC